MRSNGSRNKKVAFVMPGQARAQRIDGAQNGTLPKDFFYGGLDLRSKGYDVDFFDSNVSAGNNQRNQFQWLERKLNGITQLGLYVSPVRALIPELRNYATVVSFTDSFSFSLGILRRSLPNTTKVIGGFHGLAEMHTRSRYGLRGASKALVSKSLRNLDYVITSGSADKQAAQNIYRHIDIDSYDFGIDIDFWSPRKGNTIPLTEPYFLSVGSDPQRDYATLLRCSPPIKLKIVTRLRLQQGSIPRQFEILSGSLSHSNLTDVDVREMYHRAVAVIVPIKDVWQPSGCSVTLQAMSCGCPVIITDYKGLFDRDLLKSGHNCILVPNGNPDALNHAMQQVWQNPEFRKKLSVNAAKTAREHFGIERVTTKLQSILNK